MSCRLHQARLSALLMLIVCMALGRQARTQNLIINGSFESPVIAPQSFSLLNSIPGWTADSGLGIEIQNSAYPGDIAFDGSQNIEIASAGSESFYQDIHTTAGWQYQLTFAHSARPGVQYNGVSVYWNGVLLDTVDADGRSLTRTDWHLKSYLVVASGTTTRLQFRTFNTNLNPNGGEGGLLDDVTLTPNTYSVLDLGSFGYPNPSRRSSVYVYGLNNLGQAVGDSGGYFGTYIIGNTVYSDYNTHGFRTRPNSPINQSTDDIGAFLTNGYDESHARGINDSGQVVGFSFGTTLPADHAFRTRSNQAINPSTDDLGTYSAYGYPSGSQAYAINNNGEVTGLTGSHLVNSAAVDSSGFRTSPTGAPSYSMQIFAAPYAGSATSINKYGQIVGSFGTPYSEGPFVIAASPSLTTSYFGGGIPTFPYGINDVAQIVGVANGAAFRIQPNSTSLDILGSLGHNSQFAVPTGGDASTAYAINNSGDVVGTATTDSDVSHAFIYRAGNLFDLNELVTVPAGITFSDARAINDNGQIAVNGSDNRNGTYAYVLTPSTPSVNYLRVTASGLIYNRQTGTYNATLTITNTASAPIYGPLQVVLTNLTSGATLAKSTGIRNGNPYITIPSAVRVMPGAAVSVPVSITYTGSARLGYTPTAYSQGF